MMVAGMLCCLAVFVASMLARLPKKIGNVTFGKDCKRDVRQVESSTSLAFFVGLFSLGVSTLFNICFRN
jgi:hypothetical protein